MGKHDPDVCGCGGRHPLPGQREFFAPEKPGEPGTGQPGSDLFALGPILLEAAKAAGIVPPDTIIDPPDEKLSAEGTEPEDDVS